MAGNRQEMSALMKIKTTMKKNDVVKNGYKEMRTRFGAILQYIAAILCTISLQSHKGKVSEPERPAELRRKTDVADLGLLRRWMDFPHAQV